MIKIILAILLAMPGIAQARALTDAGTFGTNYPYIYRLGQPSVLLMRGNSDNQMYVLEVDSSTGGLLTTVTGSDMTKTIVASLSYSSTNVTTAAYVQLIASTANALNKICVSDKSGHIIKIATGAAASEVDRIYLPAGASGCYGINIPVSTRISLKALDATANSDYFVFTGFQ